MSATEIKAVWPEDRVEVLADLSNSWGSAPIVWDAIWKRYGPRDKQEGSFLLAGDDLWNLHSLPEMLAHHRAVFMMTFDNVIVMRADYEQAAKDIRLFLRDFPQEPEGVNHWPVIADLFESTPDVPALGFYWTSVAADPFQGEWDFAADEESPLDWSIFWDLYAEARRICADVDNRNDSSESAVAVQEGAER